MAPKQTKESQEPTKSKSQLSQEDIEQINETSEDELQQAKVSGIEKDDTTVDRSLPPLENREDFVTHTVYVYKAGLMVSFNGNNGGRLSFSRASLINFSTELRNQRNIYKFKSNTNGNVTKSKALPIQRFNFKFQADKKTHLRDLLGRSIKDTFVDTSKISLKYARVNVTNDMILLFVQTFKTRELAASLEYGSELSNHGILINFDEFDKIISYIDIPTSKGGYEDSSDQEEIIDDV